MLTGFVTLAGVLWFSGRSPVEPIWNGHRLSDWLEMYDTSLRFEIGDGRHPKLTDEEIEEALDGIGTNALPFLQRWLAAKPERTRPWLNSQLAKLDWVRFRFVVDDTRYDCIAVTGFQYYAETAQPLLWWLVKLSNSRNAHTRMLAYEAAFFARPPKQDFLALADRALQDRAARCEATAAQWMMERFPEEAVKRDLNWRFGQVYVHPAETKADAE